MLETEPELACARQVACPLYSIAPDLKVLRCFKSWLLWLDPEWLAVAEKHKLNLGKEGPWG